MLARGEETFMLRLFYALLHTSPVLSHSSVSEVQWEAEFFSLQDNNNKLVAALHEANANVDQWKKQLAAYQEETETLRQRVSTGGLLQSRSEEALSQRQMVPLTPFSHQFPWVSAGDGMEIQDAVWTWQGKHVKE